MSVFRAGNHKFLLGKKTYVMGILNVTPDSFSDGGKWESPDKAIFHALEMQKFGADIIDIGAQSTRPGYEEISADEELQRLLPVLKALQNKINVPISIDTYYPRVAKEALQLGASIINDVTGFKNEEMLSVVLKSDCGLIVMHNEGIDSMKAFFENFLEKAKQYKIEKSRVCFDPGIGFGKTYEENLLCIKNLADLKVKDYAILMGLSKKRFIGRASDEVPINERLFGTIAADTVAIINGADIIRVHDVKEAVLAAKVTDAILHA
ncbi:MAG: Dihydropteroate synthase [Eubacteriales bacterium SKADARSKE-1]|nr:Dihydropteroate synthase [Eubacteriales bacterium SKADARSKE-1]